MVMVSKIATGTTGKDESVTRIEVQSDRKVTALVSFLPESGKLRPEVRSDAQFTEEEKKAVLDWIEREWPNSSFLHPADWWVTRTPTSGR